MSCCRTIFIIHLDVAVDDAAGVQEVHASRDVQCNDAPAAVPHVLGRLLPQSPPQIAALHVLQASTVPSAERFEVTTSTLSNRCHEARCKSQIAFTMPASSYRTSWTHSRDRISPSQSCGVMRRCLQGCTARLGAADIAANSTCLLQAVRTGRHVGSGSGRAASRSNMWAAAAPCKSRVS